MACKLTRCRNSPGDRASSFLDQWEEQSAKIVFEKPLNKELVFDACLDHPSFEWDG